jgi:hypothetical protein
MRAAAAGADDRPPAPPRPHLKLLLALYRKVESETAAFVSGNARQLLAMRRHCQCFVTLALQGAES